MNTRQGDRCSRRIISSGKPSIRENSVSITLNLVQARVARFVHFSHASRTDQRNDLVWPQMCTSCQRHNQYNLPAQQTLAGAAIGSRAVSERRRRQLDEERPTVRCDAGERMVGNWKLPVAWLGCKDRFRLDGMRRSIPEDATLWVIKRIHSVQLEIRRSTP
jgi:hypothetical protein